MLGKIRIFEAEVTLIIIGTEVAEELLGIEKDHTTEVDAEIVMIEN